MRGQPGFWDVDERYARLSEAGDPLEKLNSVVPWEVFRKPLARALKRSDGSKGGRPPYDPVLMFKGAYRAKPSRHQYIPKPDGRNGRSGSLHISHSPSLARNAWPGFARSAPTISQIKSCSGFVPPPWL